MTRAEVAALVGSELGTVLADAGIGTADDATGLKLVIDRALRGMGYAVAQVPTAAPPEADDALFEAAVTYLALRRAWRAIADRMRIAVGGDSFALEQTFANVKSLMEDAYATLLGLGGIIGIGSGGLWFGSMELAFTAAAASGDEFAQEDA